MLFRDRKHAGELLALKLSAYKKDPDTIILALPRGGVEVGRAIADQLQLPLDITVPRKIALSQYPEYAIGAITETGEGFFNEKWIRSQGIPPGMINQQIEREKKEAQRRLELYRGNRPPFALEGKTIILVDDGIATGFTMTAALHSVKKRNPKKVIIAVPVAPSEIKAKFKTEADEFIALNFPEPFFAVGRFYENFMQVTDEEVIRLMQSS